MMVEGTVFLENHVVDVSYLISEFLYLFCFFSHNFLIVWKVCQFFCMQNQNVLLNRCLHIFNDGQT